MKGRLLSLAAKAIGIAPHEIARIAISAPRRYKVYQISKRSGGERTIAQPAREVKALQYFLMDQLLSKLPVHEAAKAYRPKLNVRDNALVHASCSTILKMDFEDFFGSIKASDFERHCREHLPELDNDDRRFCSHVLFWQADLRGPLRLSIGAPSSPMVSNTVVLHFDRMISEMCQRVGANYSRYADDLTFSSNNIDSLIGIRAELPRILAGLPYPILYVNHEKTVLVTRARRRMVTGLVLANDGKVSLGREKKRLLRAMVHASIRGNLGAEDTELLRGQLAYCKSVEPEFFARLELKYGEKVLSGIMKRQFVRRARVP